MFSQNSSGGSGGGAPADAQYIVAAANSDLTAERVATDTSTVAWDFGTAAQAKANVPDKAITYAKIQDITATSRILGRNSSGSGVTEECTLSQVLDFIGSAAQGDILYRDSAAWARLAAGTSGMFLKTLGAGANPAWATPGGVTTYAAAPNSDIPVNDTNLVTIVSQSVTGIVAGDQIEIAGEGLFFNNSGTTRTLTVNYALGALALELADGVAMGASATNMGVVDFRATFSVSASNLTKVNGIYNRSAPGAADGDLDVTGGSGGSVKRGWNTSTSDFTGTQTVTFKVKSSNATATQTFTLLHWTVRKTSAT